MLFRSYPAACPQYGQSSINAKPWVKGLSCQPLSIRNGYLYINSPDISCFFAGFPHLLQDHLPRHLIDGRASYRLLQPWLCYCPNTLAAPKGSFAPFRTLYLAIYQHAVGDIRVIPAIFFNRAGYAGRRPVFLRGIRYFYVIDLKGCLLYTSFPASLTPVITACTAASLDMAGSKAMFLVP